MKQLGQRFMKFIQNTHVMRYFLTKDADLQAETFLLKMSFAMHGIFQTSFSAETFRVTATFYELYKTGNSETLGNYCKTAVNFFSNTQIE